MQSVAGTSASNVLNELHTLGINGIPWRRFYARSFDYMLMPLELWIGIFSVELLTPVDVSAALQAFGTIPGIVVMILGTLVFGLALNARFINVTGTTPGKFIFGIRVLEQDGSKLSFWRAFKRELMVLTFGYGLMVPIVNLFAMAIAMGYVAENGYAWWDKRMSFEVHYREATQRQWAIWAAVVLFLLAGPGGIKALFETIFG